MSLEARNERVRADALLIVLIRYRLTKSKVLNYKKTGVNS
jgi:hypothetical protein